MAVTHDASGSRPPERFLTFTTEARLCGSFDVLPFLSVARTSTLNVPAGNLPWRRTLQSTTPLRLASFAFIQRGRSQRCFPVLIRRFGRSHQLQPPPRSRRRTETITLRMPLPSEAVPEMRPRRGLTERRRRRGPLRSSGAAGGAAGGGATGGAGVR